MVWLTTGVLLMIVSLTLSVKPRSPFFRNIVETAAEFVMKEPGRYAMSAGSGITSYITGAEIVRLDGSAEDLELLKMIDVQESLDKAFQKYGIDYYIAVNAEKGEKCYSARVPGQNRFGGTNKGMSTWLCTDPVFEKQAAPDVKISVFKISGTEGSFIPGP